MVRFAVEGNPPGAREHDVDAIWIQTAEVERTLGVIHSTAERYDSGASRQVAMDSCPRPPEERQVLDDQVD